MLTALQQMLVRNHQAYLCTTEARHGDAIVHSPALRRILHVQPNDSHPELEKPELTIAESGVRKIGDDR
jgi:hypothetical protein